MPRTEAAAVLTEHHRRAQLQLRAQAAQQYMRLWPLWGGDEASFRTLVSAAVPLTRAHYRLSSSLASAYYLEHRKAEGVGGAPAPRTGTFDPDKLTASLAVTGREMTQKAILAGQSPQAAMRTAVVRTTGTVTRFTLMGGRDTIVESVAADRETHGWGRVTSGEPCAFCAMVASRGPVFSEDSADFEAHDHCACCGEPMYADSEWPGRAREFRDLYNRSIREAREAGELGRDTSNDALNAFRRALAEGA